CAHLDPRAAAKAQAAVPSDEMGKLVLGWRDETLMTAESVKPLRAWLDAMLPLVEEGSSEEERHAKLLLRLDLGAKRDAALATLGGHRPVFVLFNNYFRV